MQYKRSSVLLVFFLFITAAAVADSGFTADIYDAYIEGNIEAWKPLIEKMGEEYKKSGDNSVLLELLILEYGYVGFVSEGENPKKALKYLKTALGHADILLKIDEYSAAAFALKGALFGHQININPGRAMFLGPKSQDNVDQALEIDSNSSFGWIELANTTRDRPPFVGGSPEKSLEMFEKGIDILESDGDTEKNWYYLNALLRLARTYRMTGNNGLAEKTYQKFISVAPECRWVLEEI